MAGLTPALLLGAAGLAVLPALREALRRPVSTRRRGAAPGDFVALPQGVTHYSLLGPPQGPLVVCVHGLTSPSIVFRGLARLLAAQGHRILIYDLYGRGWSDRPRAAQTPAFFVAQLRALLAALAIDGPVTLVGYSMGGVIASRLAAETPGQVTRLVLIAPAGMALRLGGVSDWARDWPLIGDWAFHMAWPWLHTRALRRADDGGSRVDGLTPALVAELGRRGYVRSVLSATRYCLRGTEAETHRRLAALGLPVTAIWGARDAVIPKQAVGLLAQWNRSARHVVIEDGDHGLPYTHPGRIADAIGPAG